MFYIYIPGEGFFARPPFYHLENAQQFIQNVPLRGDTQILEWVTEGQQSFMRRVQ